MMTVHEVSKISGVSIRALHHYDHIGLLPATEVTEAGYRLYNETALERLQHILLFKELEFSLKDIKEILDSPDFDRSKALEQQIHLLELQKEHIENLIDLARGIKMIGAKPLMDFTAFDTRKMDEYARQAKESWGKTAAYQEFEQKDRLRSDQQRQDISEGMMELFAVFGTMRKLDPADDRVQAQVGVLQAYITEHFYHCTKEILQSLGCMYSGGGSMTENIDAVGGKGTAVFAGKAIAVYCQKP